MATVASRAFTSFLGAKKKVVDGGVTGSLGPPAVGALTRRSHGLSVVSSIANTVRSSNRAGACTGDCVQRAQIEKWKSKDAGSAPDISRQECASSISG